MDGARSKFVSNFSRFTIDGSEVGVGNPGIRWGSSPRNNINE